MKLNIAHQIEIQNTKRLNKKLINEILKVVDQEKLYLLCETDSKLARATRLNTLRFIYRLYRKSILRCNVINEHTNQEIRYFYFNEIFLKGYKFKHPDLSTLVFSSVLDFGKYKESTIQEILNINPQYIIWLSENTDYLIHPQVIKEAKQEIRIRSKRYKNKDRYNTKQYLKYLK